MSDPYNLIKTKIVSNDLDHLWDEQRIVPLKENDVLVISTQYDAGSPEEAQLIKMMQACKLEPEGYLVLQLEQEEIIGWHKLRDKVKPKTVVLLGISPASLGLSVHLMPHQVGRFDGCNWIPTLGLIDLNKHPEIKGHFWNYGLKPVFIDKVYG
jgi:hypothetical protein